MISLSKTLLTLLFTYTLIVSRGQCLGSYEVLLNWKILDFQFPSLETRNKFIQTKQFIPENNIIAGIKVHGSRVLITVPRWRSGVPSTLNVVDLNGISAISSNSSPKLDPYPSWNMQRIGNCSALQFVQSMEIDEYGRMWVIDTGRVNTWAEPPEQVLNLCPAKIVLIDLTTNQVLGTHTFPSDVISPSTNFLNDIVVDCSRGQRRCWAYMSDASDRKIVVYDMKTDRSWYVHHSTMAPDLSLTNISILGRNYTSTSAINGIALSPKFFGHDRIFYNPVASLSTYSVPTSILQTARNGETLHDIYISTIPGNRSSQADGLAMDARGLMYYGLLGGNAIAFTDVNSPSGFYNAKILAQNDVELQWQSTFAMDNLGYLYVTASRYQSFQAKTMNWSDVNFRVARVFVGSRSYMYYPN